MSLFRSIVIPLRRTYFFRSYLVAIQGNLKNFHGHSPALPCFDDDALQYSSRLLKTLRHDLRNAPKMIARSVRFMLFLLRRVHRPQVSALVEKFDTELFSDFSAKSSNFRRLVLSCINADFCVQGLILQRFSKSTRLPHLCTARNSKSSQIFVKLFISSLKFQQKSRFFSNFHRILHQFQ